MSSANPIAPAMSFVTYVFPYDTFNGPLEDPSTGRPLYNISSTNEFFSANSTTLARPDGSPVGVINWERLLHSMTVNFHGREADGNTFVVSKAEFFKGTKSSWVDKYGNPFYWQDGNVSCPLRLHAIRRAPHRVLPSAITPRSKSSHVTSIRCRTCSKKTSRLE